MAFSQINGIAIANVSGINNNYTVLGGNTGHTASYLNVDGIPFVTYFVRPSGGTYGSENGSSYANAWDGFANISWASVAGYRLTVCGTHVAAPSPRLIAGANNVTIIGNDPNEAGVIDGEDTRPTGMTIDGYTGIIVSGLTVIDHTTQNVLAQNGASFTTYNCTFSGAGNEAIQHLDTSRGNHYNLTANDNGDESISCHDSARADVYGGQFRNNVSAFVNVGVGTCIVNIYDVWDTSGNLVDLQGNTGCVFNVYRCRLNKFTLTTAGTINFYDSYIFRSPTTSVNDNIGGTIRLYRCILDCSNMAAVANIGALDFQNGTTVRAEYTIFKGMPATTYAMLVRATTTVEGIVNCIFLGASDVGRGIFRAMSFTVYNCIFYDLERPDNTGGTGTLTFNSCDFFGNSIAPVGTQVSCLTADPLFTNVAGLDFTLQGGSTLIGAGNTRTGFETGIATANWGSAGVAPVITTKSQPASWVIGPMIP